MSRYEAGEITKNGVTVPIFVDDDGEWQATYAGSYLKATSRLFLATKIAKAVKGTTVKVSIPFTQRRPNGQIIRGTATGIHSGNGNILVEWSNGNKEQLDSRGTILGKLTPDEITEWVTLIKQRDQAVEAVHRFEVANRIYLSQVVKDAIETEVAKIKEESE